MNPIECVKSKEDGVWVVYYFGKEAGWITKAKHLVTNKEIFKALTIHSSVKSFYSLAAAKHWVLGEYH